jgi:hypothetical protein
MLDARLAARAGTPDRTDALLAQAVRWSDEAEDAPRRWRARELRVELLRRDDDRAALRAFLRQTADALPEPLKTQFLRRPRVSDHLSP